MKVSDYVSVISLALAIGSLVYAYLEKMKAGATKAYAAERDFNHLRNNQEQMKQNMAVMLEQIDVCTDQIIELRTRIDYWLTHSKNDE